VVAVASLLKCYTNENRARRRGLEKTYAAGDQPWRALKRGFRLLIT